MSTKKEIRRHKRYSVEGVQGNVLYSSDLEVLNISIDGAAIETERRLELNREYMFKILFKDTFLNLRGRVVWAVLVSKAKKGSKPGVPVYRVGIKFTETLSEKANILLRFIEDNRIKTLEKRLGGARFKLVSTDKIKIDYPYRYKVKKISLSGMLAETEYPLDINSHYNIELFLNEKILNIVGKVINCEKVESSIISTYEIGIEFFEMPDESRKLLGKFLSLLEEV